MTKPPFIVVSGPSGSGKTTLCRRYATEHGFHYGISHTTRPMRPNEKDGVDYFFTPQSKFDEMVQQGAFLEWAQVYGNSYGTSKTEVDSYREKGVGVILDVDTQGAMSIKAICEDAFLIFVRAPSIGELEKRLKNRGSDSPEVIERRLKKAREEEGFQNQYHAVIVNDDLNRAYGELEDLIG